MSSELERLVALVTCVNVYLKGDENKYDLDPILTEYCYGMEFIRNPIPDIAGSMKTIASDAKQWVVHMREESPRTVRLHYNPSTRDDIPQGIRDEIIANGSDWLIETQYSWLNRLYINIKNRQKLGVQQLWKTYFVLLEGASKNLEDTSPSVKVSIDHLDHILEMLNDFAGKFEYTRHWAEKFVSSRKLLHNHSHSIDIAFIPDGIYSEDACHLLQAAFSSWVFGGMGSWSDLAFNGDDANQYASLTRQLYETICTSIGSVVNSYP